MPDQSIRVVVKGFIGDLRSALRGARGEVRGFAKDVEREDRRIVKSNKDVHRSFMDLDGAVGKVNRTFTLMRNAMSLLKWPALITAVGLAVQVLGQLSAGALALVGSLGNLSGLLVLYPAMLGSIGQALGVVKLGFGEVGKALGGNAQAMKRLNAEQKSFVQYVQRDLKPAFKELRLLAGKGMFPGMEKGAKSAFGNMDVFKGIVGGTAQEIGALAAAAGKLVGSKAFGRDLAKVGEQNRKMIHALGMALLGVVKAISIVLVEAEPLLRYVRRGIHDFGEWAAKSAEAGRQTGHLRNFFAGTRDTLRVLLPMLRDFTVAIVNIAKGGKPVGDSLLVSLRDSAKEFRQWTESAKGRNSIAEYFRQAEPGIRQLGGLLGDVVKMFVRLSGGSGSARLVKAIRTDLLPAVEKLVGGMTQAFGPHLIDLIVSFTKTLTVLAGPSGGLTVVADVLRMISDLVRQVFSAPGIGNFAFAMVTAGGVFKGLKWGGMVGASSKLAKLWQSIAYSAEATAAANAASGLAGGAAAGGAAAAGKKVIYGSKGEVLKTVGGAAAGGAATRLPWGQIAGNLGKVLAKYSLIASGLLASYGAIKTPGGVGARLHGAVSTMTGGLIKPFTTADERRPAAVRRAEIRALGTGALRGGQRQVTTGAGGFSVGNQAKKDWDDLTAKQKRATLTLREYAKEARSIGLKPASIKLVGAKQALANIRLLKGGFQQLSIGAISDVRELHKQVGTNLRLINSTLQGEAAHKALRRNFRLSMQNVSNLLHSGQLSTKQAMTEVERLLRQHSGAGKDAVGKNFEQVKSFIRKNMSDSKGLTAAGAKAMRDILMKELTTVYGLTPQEARFRAAGKEFSGKSSPGGTTHTNAAGGLVTFGKAGERGRDTIPTMIGGHRVMVGSGEVAAVFNSTQQQTVDALARAAGYGGLKGLMAANAKPHYMAGGGLVGLGHQLQSEGYEVGEHPAFGGVNPVHSPHSYHYKGMAIDVNDDSPPFGYDGSEFASLSHLASRLKGMPGVLELLWQVKGHFDHLHLAMGGGGGTLAGGAPLSAKMLKGVGVTGPDSLMKAVMQTGQDRLHDTAQARLEEFVASASAMTTSITGESELGAGALSRAQVERLWIQAGGNPAYAHQMATIAWSESRWNPSSVNAKDGGAGIWQITPAQPGSLDPLTNARQAVAKMNAAISYGWDPFQPWQASASVWQQRNSAPGAAMGALIGNPGGGANAPSKGKGKGGLVAQIKPHHRHRKGHGKGQIDVMEKLRKGHPDEPLTSTLWKLTRRSEDYRVTAGDRETFAMIDNVLSPAEQSELIMRWTQILGIDQSRLGLTSRVERKARRQAASSRTLIKVAKADGIRHGHEVGHLERQANVWERELTGLRKKKKPTSAEKDRMKRLRERIMTNRKGATFWRKQNMRNTGWEVPTEAKLRRQQGGWLGTYVRRLGGQTDLITSMDEFQRPGGIQTEINEAMVNIARLKQGSGTTDPAAAGPDLAGLNALLTEQLAATRTSLRIQGAQLDTFRGFAPFIGRFAHGGPIVENGLAYLHRGERVIADPDGPYGNRLATARAPQGAVHVTLGLDDQGLLQIIDQRVEASAGKVTVAAGRRTGRFARAPGGVATGRPGR